MTTDPMFSFSEGVFCGMSSGSNFNLASLSKPTVSSSTAIDAAAHRTARETADRESMTADAVAVVAFADSLCNAGVDRGGGV